MKQYDGRAEIVLPESRENEFEERACGEVAGRSGRGGPGLIMLLMVMGVRHCLIYTSPFLSSGKG